MWVIILGPVSMTSGTNTCWSLELCGICCVTCGDILSLLRLEPEHSGAGPGELAELPCTVLGWTSWGKRLSPWECPLHCFSSGAEMAGDGQMMADGCCLSVLSYRDARTSSVTVHWNITRRVLLGGISQVTDSSPEGARSQKPLICLIL